MKDKKGTTGNRLQKNKNRLGYIADNVLIIYLSITISVFSYPKANILHSLIMMENVELHIKSQLLYVQKDIQ